MNANIYIEITDINNPALYELDTDCDSEDRNRWARIKDQERDAKTYAYT